ncbi:MAG TPA: MerR family DNA-binding transcriptional regulator [Vicinamibacteria bacterium]
MRIGELARLSGVRPATLRYYEGRGLLSRPARTDGGYRSYTPESAAQLRMEEGRQRVGPIDWPARRKGCHRCRDGDRAGSLTPRNGS